MSVHYMRSRVSDLIEVVDVVAPRHDSIKCSDLNLRRPVTNQFGYSICSRCTILTAKRNGPNSLEWKSYVDMVVEMHIQVRGPTVEIRSELLN